MTDLDFVSAIDNLVATWHTLNEQEKIYVARTLAHHGLIEVREIMKGIYKELEQ